MERQAEPISKEFRLGQVETCKLQIRTAFVLEQREDEGPTFILDVGENEFTILCEHGNTTNEKVLQGDTVEILRLPKSKKVISVNWEGNCIGISGRISKKSLKKYVEDWSEGDILLGAISRDFVGIVND